VLWLPSFASRPPAHHRVLPALRYRTRAYFHGRRARPPPSAMGACARSPRRAVGYGWIRM